MTFEASRKKQILVLQPRGKALYEDDSSFGSKMLAKMGWSKGKGLGKQQHGNLDFIQIRYKNNANGLGYNGLKDEWTTNESQFDNLLKSLNENPDSSSGNIEESERTKTGNKSLEERSKYSRARVHYKKFTRGKDVYKYSKKDLANILGKKSLADIEEKQEIEMEILDNKPDTYESSLIVNTGLTVADYFKKKVEAKIQLEKPLSTSQSVSSTNGSKLENLTSNLGNNALDYSLDRSNVIQIPSLVAQKMSYMMIERFKSANIANIVGYGMSENVEIKIAQTKVGDNYTNTDKYSLYNMDRLTSKQHVNPRKIISNLKRTKKSLNIVI